MKHNFTLLEFMRDHKYDDNLIYKDAAIEQMIFVRDSISKLVKSEVFVISTHTSKSHLFLNKSIDFRVHKIHILLLYDM